jgi:PAS domain S-box-containing protein
VPDLIWAKDIDDRFVLVNQAICNKLLICGSPEEAIGKTDMFFAERERNAGFEHTFGEICANSDAITKKRKSAGRFLEDGLVRNKYLVLDVHKAPFLNKEGEMIGTVGCGRDVTKEREIEEALRESEQRYRALSDASFEAIFISENGICVDTNETATRMFGYDHDELIGIFGTDVIAPESKELVKHHMLSAYEEPYEAIAQRKDGTTFHVEIRGKMTEYKGRIVRTTVVHDIDKSKRAEEALRESEETLRAILAASPVGIGMASDRVFGWTNKTMYRIWGYEEDYLLGQSTEALYPDAEEYERVGREFYSQIEEKGLGQVETRWLTKDGKEVHCDLRGSPLDPSDPSKGIIVAAMDISERKQAEENLRIYQEQLRSLASELLLTEEQERRSLATDLHDSIGQVLSIAKLKTDTLRNAAGSSAFVQSLDEIRNLIGQAIGQIQSFIFELSPPVLYELGLEAALDYLLERMQNLYGLKIELIYDKQLKPLSEDLAVLSFRAVQELLVNISKHAGTRNARVSVYKDGDYIRIEVGDDGVGFEPSEIGSNVDGTGKFGLFSIRERLRHFGGRLEIASQPGHGSQITLVAPLPG